MTRTATLCAAALIAIAGQAARAEAPAEPPLHEEAEPATLPSPTAADDLLRWIVGSRDNQGLTFLIIDKTMASVSIYDADGHLIGAAPALMGLTRGDRSVEGIGDRELADISPQERTTPAGRFLAAYGPAYDGATVLWIDFDTAVSLHPVVTTNASETRLARLESPTPIDNFITYGCINVSQAFYDEVVEPHLREGQSVAYILPDTEPVNDVFPAVVLTHAPAAELAAAPVADVQDDTASEISDPPPDP